VGRACFALVIAITVFVAVGGCGSGEEANSPRLTRSQFIEQADRICSKYAEERKAAAASWLKKLPGGPSEAEKRIDDALSEIVAPSMKQEAAALAALVPPEADAARISQMVGHLQTASKTVAEEGSKGLSRSDLPMFEKEATAYGLKVCSNPY